MAHKTEFLYLSEPDTIAAGVLDVPKCINNAEEVFTLLAKGDYLMGGNNHNNHGMYIVFPKESPFPNMPVAGPDRRFVAMPVIVLGGIYSGLATPTESAVLGVIYTLIVGFFVFRTLNFKLLKEALVEAAMMSAPVMFLLGGAAVFGRLLTLQRIPEMLATAMLGLSSSKYVVMLLIMAFLLVAGMFIDTTSNIVLFAPLFCPIAQKLGLDLVYFGILMVVNLCIGFLTPPLGVNLFVAKNISGAPLGGLVKELMPYIGILVLALVLMVFFPQIVMFLPNLVGG